MSVKRRGASYEVRWRQDGKHLSASFARREDADKHELEMKRRAQLGAHGLSIPTRQTLGEYWAEWWKTESPLWARSTRIQRKTVSDRWIKKRLGGVRLRDLGTKRVREWRGEITTAGASPTQANHALSILSAALGCAVRDGALPANPCSGVRKLPVMVARPRALTPDEIEKVIRAMPKQRDRLMVALMGYGGLRPGEVIAIRWDDVRDHLLIVDRSYTAGEVRPTKTSSRRTVEIAAPLRDDLDAFRPARPEGGALVCPNRFGTYVDLDNWRRRVWDKATEASGVDATIYDLRHSYCSLLIHEGRSVPYVAAAMGHASGVTTLTHYAHLFDEQRLGTAMTMVDAITEARRGVRNLYAPAEPRRLRQAAPAARKRATIG